MNFIEAAKFINDNYEILQPKTVYTLPPHSKERVFIAPKDATQEKLATINLNIIAGIQNDSILEQMNLPFINLDVFVLVKIQGGLMFRSFDQYISMPWVFEEGRNLKN